MLPWQLWVFPEECTVSHSTIFADWWGYSLTHLWWSTEGCQDCANEIERC